MSFSTRKIVNAIYLDSNDFKKRKYNLSEYQDFFGKVNPQELILILFMEMPGNFARKLILFTLHWWKEHQIEHWIRAFNLMKNDELAQTYLVSFVKRYFDIDLTELAHSQDLYIHPITPFEHSREWILELDRINIPKEDIFKIRKTLQNQIEEKNQEILSLLKI